MLLPEFLNLQAFVNADELARGIEPGAHDLTALAAGRLMLKRMRELVSGQSSFAFETTCAGRAYVPLLSKCRSKGWQITLIYLWLGYPDVAIARVAHRVKEGGHNIPTDIIRRRFYAGVRNLFELYLPLADTAVIYDNGGAERILVAQKELGRNLLIHHKVLWRTLEEQRICN